MSMSSSPNSSPSNRSVEDTITGRETPLLSTGGHSRADMYVVKASLINEVNVVESYSTRLGEVKRKSVMGG